MISSRSADGLAPISGAKAEIGNSADKTAGSPSLPREPQVVLEPRSSWPSLNVAELWAHRELLYFLIWRGLKVRYKPTALGVAWVVLQPLLMTLIFTIVLGRLVRVPTSNIPYPLFAYAGIMLWTFFGAAVSLTSNCLVGNAALITKVYFPRLIIPIASIVARLVDLFVAFAILILIMFYYGFGVSFQFLFVIVPLLLLSLFALAFGLWTSAVNVKYRDVGLALPVIIQLWMFVSPVIYPAAIVPERWRMAYSLNPLVGILESF